MLNTGMPAPGFSLLEKRGNEVSLRDFSGKYVVLFIYPKANTSGCTLEAREFAALNGEFEALGAVVIGLSRDTVEVQAKFAEKYELPYLLLSDPEHKVIEEYGAWREKPMYGKKIMGTIRSSFIISPDGKIAAVYDKVKSAGHAEAVLQDLKALIK